jgi:hypothetical protein
VALGAFFYFFICFVCFMLALAITAVVPSFFLSDAAKTLHDKGIG